VDHHPTILENALCSGMQVFKAILIYNWEFFRDIGLDRLISSGESFKICV
jgi:hypothetical protein